MGPLLVINRVITPINDLINGQLGLQPNISITTVCDSISLKRFSYQRNPEKKTSGGWQQHTPIKGGEKCDFHLIYIDLQCWIFGCRLWNLKKWGQKTCLKCRLYLCLYWFIFGWTLIWLMASYQKICPADYWGKDCLKWCSFVYFCKSSTLGLGSKHCEPSHISIHFLDSSPPLFWIRSITISLCLFVSFFLSYTHIST